MTRPKARTIVPEAPDLATAPLPAFEPGDGALILVNLDPNAPATVQVAGVAIILQPGIAYPLPVADIFQVFDAQGQAIARRHKNGRFDTSRGCKQFGWYWNPEAAPLSRSALESIGRTRLSQQRTAMRALKTAVDFRNGMGTSGHGAFEDIWDAGARELDADGRPKGRAGALAAVKVYFDRLPEAERPQVNWAAVEQAIPVGAVPIALGNLAVVRYTGEIVPTGQQREAQERHLKAELERPPRHSGPERLTTYNLEGTQFVAAGAPEGPA